MTKASLSPNNNKNIDLVLEPIKGGDTVNDATINELIKQSEYTELYIEITNIKNAVAELNNILKPLQTGKAGREIRYEILVRKDAVIKVNIGNDEMAAEAEITTAMGGNHLTAKTILDAAKNHGVKKGFSKDDLIKVAQIAAKAEPGTIVKHEIAMGKESINGQDAKIKPLVQGAQDRILRPKEREDGSVDMRDLGDIICVEKGEPLAKKVPLTLGIKGYTVTATPIEPQPGEDTSLTAGEGTAISPENENILISTKVGLPKIIDNGMEVDEVYKIKNVDISTGHIEFQGSVIIEGDVAEGMKVIASGDITVNGFIESARLEAGGDITITSGIIGKKQEIEGSYSDISNFQMSAILKAKGNLFAKYSQYADIECDGSIRIENQLMHCLITVGGSLWIGEEEKANGKLIGGLVNAASNVKAGIVGATAGSNTLINFNNPITEYQLKIEKIDQKATIEAEKTSELQAARNKLEKLPQNPNTQEMLKKVVTTYQFHAKRMGEIIAQKEQTEAEIQTFMASVYIEATDKLYQNVEMKVGEFYERTKREYPPSKMIYKERKVIIDPIIN